MTPVVLMVLAVMWAVVIGSWIRSRGDRHGVNSISSFARHLSVLERTSPTRLGPGIHDRGNSSGVAGLSARFAEAASMDIATARRRRRNVLLALSGTAVAALLLIPFLGGLAIAIQILADLLLAAYIFLLVRTQRLAAERRAKVRYLHPVTGPAADHLAAPRRSAI